MEILLNVLLYIIIAVVIFQYIELSISNPTSTRNLENRKKSIHNITFSGNEFTIDTYKVPTIINVKVHFSRLEFPNLYEGKKIENINITSKIECKELILNESIKNINLMNITCDQVESKSSFYNVIDNMLFDRKSNLVFIGQKKSQKELLEIAKTYSISKKALFYFTNAKYHQFALYRNLDEFRFSKPYYCQEEKLTAIVPDKIEGKTVEAISINYQEITFLNLPKAISRVIIEKPCCFKQIEIDKENQNFMIYGHSLLDKTNSTFVSYQNHTLNHEGYFDKTPIKFTFPRLSRIKNSRKMEIK